MCNELPPIAEDSLIRGLTVIADDPTVTPRYSEGSA
jgi:hypothetical protein